MEEKKARQKYSYVSYYAILRGARMSKYIHRRTFQSKTVHIHVPSVFSTAERPGTLATTAPNIFKTVFQLENRDA